MFHSIEGTLLSIEPTDNEYNLAVGTKAGIAFEIKTTHTTAINCNGIGNEILLFTYFAVKEAGVELYGFIKKEEKDVFKLLITVSGVGPKAALSILSNLTPERLAVSVSKGDINTINSCKGIGPKTAQRIVLELKDKFKGFASAEGQDGFVSDTEQEAIGALMALGYNKMESARSLAGGQEGLPVEELIRYGLKNLQK